VGDLGVSWNGRSKGGSNRVEVSNGRHPGKVKAQAVVIHHSRLWPIPAERLERISRRLRVKYQIDFGPVTSTKQHDLLHAVAAARV
jgi:hypothetical protein